MSDAMPETTTTPWVEEYIEAMRDVVETAERLQGEGRDDRAAGLAVAVDLGTSAAFLFDLSQLAYTNATKLCRQAIAVATREGELTFHFIPDKGDVETFHADSVKEAQRVAAVRFHGQPGIVRERWVN